VKPPFAALVAGLEKSIPAPKPVSLPKLGDWTPTELGPPVQIPSVALDGTGVFTIKAGGTDLWNNSDSGIFIHQLIEGDCEVVARVASLSRTDAATKAGVTIRENPKADARNVALVVTAGGGVSGIRQQLRPKANTPTVEVKAQGGPPQWLKLVRKGDAITGSRSADGQTWTEIATQKLDGLPRKIYVGLVVSAHSSSATTTAKIDQAKVTPLP
jgi:hypothetical protein